MNKWQLLIKVVCVIPSPPILKDWGALRCVGLNPKIPIQRPVLDRLGDVGRSKVL